MNDSSLQGRLADFTLEEILQLMALQQKTGMLRVDASYPMVLYFEQGMLVSYRDRRSAGKDPLESYLKKYGFFPGETWEHIDFVQHNADLDLTEILVNESVLSADELGHVQQEAAQEHICNGMLLRDGLYHFSSGRESLMGLKGRVRMKVEGLLMEAVRRIDEMPALRERYPSDDVKLRRTNKEVDAAQENASARRILAICGQENTVGHVVSHARMCEFDTLNTVEMLRDQGILHVLDPTGQATKAEVKRATRATAQAARSRGRAIVLALVALAITAISLTVQPVSPYRRLHTPGTERAQRLQQDRELARVHAALLLYESAQGRYPQDLDRLSDEGFLPQPWLEDLQARVLYRPLQGGRTYQLRTRADATPG
jgi:hypothetical protein